MKLKGIYWEKQFGKEDISSDEINQWYRKNCENNGEPIFILDLEKYTSDELEELLQDLINTPSIDKKVFKKLMVSSIKSTEDAQRAVQLAKARLTQKLIIVGELDGISLEGLEELTNLNTIAICNVGKQPADLGTIKLPPNHPEVGIRNISETTKISEPETDKTKNLYRVYHVDNVAQLQLDRIEEISKRFDIDYIEVEDQNEGEHFSINVRNNRSWHWYSPDTYTEIMKALAKKTENVDMTMSEEERVSEIFHEISSIQYDNELNETYFSNREASMACFRYIADENDEIKRILFPNPAERININHATCARNLINGLLAGQCVCVGKAEILRNASALYGIEACNVSGLCRGVTHSWCKIKVDGAWYNFDPTLDRDNFSNYKDSQFSFKTDEEFQKLGYFIPISLPKGPVCNTKHKTKSNIVKRFLRLLGHWKKPVPLSLPASTTPQQEKNGDNPWRLENFGASTPQHNAEAAIIAQEHSQKTRQPMDGQAQNEDISQ